ncbi:MAG: hypothetical protein Q7S22_04005 [Candidatus Micrarchaeota archaeon]|nr:hypothetical protein [Candidatus Micrarchaeota archaeon]
MRLCERTRTEYLVRAIQAPITTKLMIEDIRKLPPLGFHGKSAKILEYLEDGSSYNANFIVISPETIRSQSIDEFLNGLVNHLRFSFAFAYIYAEYDLAISGYMSVAEKNLPIFLITTPKEQQIQHNMPWSTIEVKKEDVKVVKVTDLEMSEIARKTLGTPISSEDPDRRRIVISEEIIRLLVQKIIFAIEEICTELGM